MRCGNDSECYSNACLKGDNKYSLFNYCNKEKESIVYLILLIGLGSLIVILFIVGYFIISEVKGNDFQDDNITYVIRR